MAKVTDIVVGVIIFAIASGILFTAWANLGSEYNVGGAENYSDYYESVNKTFGTTYSITSNLSEKASGDIKFFESGGVGRLVIEAFKLPLKALSTTSTLIQSTFEYAGLPGGLAWIFTAILSLITLAIVWALLSAFFGRTT